MKILIDNGHGSDTPGKCSPDGKHREYKWAREIAARLERELKALGYDAERIVTEETDVPIFERVRRVNAKCAKFGKQNCVLVSLHNNAAPPTDGKWHDATGWSVFVSPNASANSKRLAALLYTEAEKHHLKGNRSVPKERYWVGNFGILRQTNCPAVLTENMFQDNREDVMLLWSEQGKRSIVQLHVAAITEYIGCAR